jgi:transcriptional regulator with XRE-family HTH domain
MAWRRQNLKRSYQCNADLIRFLRHEKNWPQRQLAKKTGYSERLISKAESRQPISADAINVLAETLGIPSKPVCPEDLICDVIELAKSYVRSLYRDHQNFFNAISPFLDDDIEFHVAGDSTEIPFAGIHRGHGEVKAAVDLLFSILQPPIDFDYMPHYQYANYGNDVLITGET